MRCIIDLALKWSTRSLLSNQQAHATSDRHTEHLEKLALGPHFDRLRDEFALSVVHKAFRNSVDLKEFVCLSSGIEKNRIREFPFGHKRLYLAVQRKHYSPEEKLAILRRHLLEEERDRKLLAAGKNRRFVAQGRGGSPSGLATTQEIR